LDDRVDYGETRFRCLGELASTPDGTVAEVVPMGRYEKMKAAE